MVLFDLASCLNQCLTADHILSPALFLKVDGGELWMFWHWFFSCFLRAAHSSLALSVNLPDLLHTGDINAKLPLVWNDILNLKNGAFWFRYLKSLVDDMSVLRVSGTLKDGALISKIRVARWLPSCGNKKTFGVHK